MLQAFTRNYADNSTEAGFQFTFYCDKCEDGFKSSFIESATHKRGGVMRAVGQGAGILGSFIGGQLGNAGWAAERGADVISERFTGASPEWQKEHEQAFERAKNEAMRHFHRCPACQKYVCDACHNEDEGMCVECAPRQEVAVAKARADAMRRNIEETAQTATVWAGKLESKTTVCPACGKPAGTGKFCNNCGASLALNECPTCGKENAQGVRFCNHCGASMTAPQSSACSSCGQENPPGTRFCGGCGTSLG
jgi:hypothetical protein